MLRNILSSGSIARVTASSSWAKMRSSASALRSSSCSSAARRVALSVASLCAVSRSPAARFSASVRKAMVFWSASARRSNSARVALAWLPSSSASRATAESRSVIACFSRRCSAAVFCSSSLIRRSDSKARFWKAAISSRAVSCRSWMSSAAMRCWSRWPARSLIRLSYTACSLRSAVASPPPFTRPMTRKAVAAVDQATSAVRATPASN